MSRIGVTFLTLDEAAFADPKPLKPQYQAVKNRPWRKGLRKY